MKIVDYYFSVLSPFTYLAGDRLERICASHGASIAYRPMDIMSLFAHTGGVPPKDRHPARQAYRLQDLERTARCLRMPINLNPAHWPTDPGPASRAIISAIASGGGDVGLLVRAVLRSCWADQRNIAEPDVVADCLGEAGCTITPDDDAAASVLVGNTEQAIAANVFGAPSYVVDGQVMWGQDRLEHLDVVLSGDQG